MRQEEGEGDSGNMHIDHELLRVFGLLLLVVLVMELKKRIR